MFHQRRRVKECDYFWQCFDLVLRDQMRKKATLFDMACSLFEYHSAVRGHHYYKKYWQPIDGQTLDFMREKDNPFYFFAKKVMEQNSGRTLEHSNGEFSSYRISPPT